MKEATLNFLNCWQAAGSVTHNCLPGQVAAGASCTLNISFTPSASSIRTGISANTPQCSLSAAPARIQPGRLPVVTASCTPASVTYTWTGGNCASSTGATCTDTPAVTTPYGVTGGNSEGSSAATATVTVKSVDLTPILMLLLD